jgi:hypothetical protein
MSRNRLTNRVASDMKSKPGSQVEDKGSGIDNDVFDMNDTGHSKNNPSVGQYAKGDPEAWNEGVNKEKVNKDDQKREETGHAPLIDKHAAQEAIASARRLEEKAVKAIIASQRMLPGATDAIIEKQAGILMHLPEEGLNATLANQEGLAQMIAKAAASSSEEEEDASSKEGTSKTLDEEEDASSKDAAKKEEDEEDASSKDAAKKEEDEDEASSKDAAKKEEDEDEASSKDAGQNDPHYFDLKKKKEKLANLKKQAEELEKEVDKDEKKEEEEVEASAKCKKDEDEEEASSKDASLLDQIFSGVMPSPIKKGASKLSGMVKKEASSSGASDLSSLWSTAPDVREVFN